jgi:DNA invertase Pin-like site-specific DNA recombinase
LRHPNQLKAGRSQLPEEYYSPVSVCGSIDCAATNWRIIAEFTEVESGRKSERPQLDAAGAAARLRRVPVIVAKVDRLTRSVAFLSRLLEAGVDVRFADLPQIEGPTGRFMLQQMASVAELEAGLISARTKAALAASKARGTRLGGNRGTVPDADARAAGLAARRDRARKRALDIQPVINDLRAAGVTSLNGLARALTEKGIPTGGNTSWTASQLDRVLSRPAEVIKSRASAPRNHEARPCGSTLPCPPTTSASSDRKDVLCFLI